MHRKLTSKGLTSFCRETGETDYAKAGIADGYGRFVSVITMNGNQKCPLEAAPMGWFFLLAMDGIGLFKQYLLGRFWFVAGRHRRGHCPLPRKGSSQLMVA